MSVNLRLHLLRAAQRIPQSINLVEHHQARVSPVTFGDQMFAPDGEIGFRDAGIGRQNKHHCMRLWNQADGQLRLGTNGVQPRRIQNDQALLEQRMAILIKA